MFYIHSIASISHQNSFRNEGFSKNLKVLNEENELISPDYKEILPPTALRRLSTILKIGMTAAIECQSEIEYDAIVVGTALGCLQDTEKFLVTIETATSDVLSPTAFIQSTHNTIGGSISLSLKNHGYNMTHTQNALSFEVSLIDAILLLKEDKENVLLGAADEKIEFLKNLQPNLISDKYPLSTLATFMNLKNEKHSDGIYIKDVYVNFNTQKDIQTEIDTFLTSNGLSTEKLINVYHSNVTELNQSNYINYLPFTGLNYSASALACHFAQDELKNLESGSILIVNNLCSGNLGLTLIQK